MHFEAAFLPRNYLHLTGVRTTLKSVDFYNMAVRDRLSERDFRFADDGTTDKKLGVLPALMRIHLTARMVGDYDYSKSFLVTDKVAGTVTAAMGFRKNGDRHIDIYVPNTALSTDMRLITRKPVQRIAAIFVKPQNEKIYTHLTYIAKGMAIEDEILTPILKEKVDVENLRADFEIDKKTKGTEECFSADKAVPLGLDHKYQKPTKE